MPHRPVQWRSRAGTAADRLSMRVAGHARRGWRDRTVRAAGQSCPAWSDPSCSGGSRVGRRAGLRSLRLFCFALAARPVARRVVAGYEVAGVERRARQIAVAIARLRARPGGAPGLLRRGLPAAFEPRIEHPQAAAQAVAADRPKAQFRATGAAGAGTIGARKALARREVALIEADRPQGKVAQQFAAARDRVPGAGTRTGLPDPRQVTGHRLPTRLQNDV